MIKGHATNFVLIDSSVDNLTFDTEVATSSGQPFDLGGLLHTLYTNETSDVADCELREALEGLGITYDRIKIHTLIDRVENPDQAHQFAIKDFVPSKPATKAQHATESKRRKNKSESKGMAKKSKPESSTSVPTSKKLNNVIPAKTKADTTNTSKTQTRSAPNGKPPSAKQPESKTVTQPSVTLDQARTNYEHWYLKGGPGGIAYALRNYMADEQRATESSWTPAKDIMIGTMSADRNDFIATLQLLYAKGLLDKKTLAPTGGLKTRVDSALQLRSQGQSRALRLRQA